MLKNYIKIAFKVLLRRKFFTFISLFGISFTMIVLIVATSFYDHLFGPFPPEIKLDRTLYVFDLLYRYPQGGMDSADSENLSHYAVERFIRPLEGIEQVSIFQAFAHSHTHYNDQGDKVDSYLKYVDAAFWEIMEFNFVEGAGFTQRDVADAQQVTVINAATRHRLFGDEPAVGRTLKVNRQELRVIGVVDNVSRLRVLAQADIWVPYSIDARFRAQPLRGGQQDMHGPFSAVILATRSSDLLSIKADFRQGLSTLRYPYARPLIIAVDGYAETLFENMSASLFHGLVDDTEREGERFPLLLSGVIMGCALVFMLLPAVNLVNINLSRIMERSSEIGVRKAFGASSQTLVGQFIVENIMLTLLGGVIGFIGALGVLQFVNSIDLIPYAQFQLNLRVFLYGMLMALFFGVFSGVYPAWRMSRLHPVAALQRRKK